MTQSKAVAESESIRVCAFIFNRKMKVTLLVEPLKRLTRHCSHFSLWEELILLPPWTFNPSLGSYSAGWGLLFIPLSSQLCLLCRIAVTTSAIADRSSPDETAQLLIHITCLLPSDSPQPAPNHASYRHIHSVTVSSQLYCAHIHFIYFLGGTDECISFMLELLIIILILSIKNLLDEYGMIVFDCMMWS